MARISRRDLLRAACAAGVGFVLPGIAYGAPGVAATPQWGRSLILVELDGGNDGLNTVIPYANQDYLNARPTLGITANPLFVGTSNGMPLTLNPVMTWAKTLFTFQELAIVLGVGMPNPNRSHFRGMDIWNTGSDSTSVLGSGWLTRMFTDPGAPALPATSVAHGALLSRSTSNPLLGSGLRVLAMDDGADFLSASAGVVDPPTSSSNPALQHVLNVQHDVVAARGLLSTALTTTPTFTTPSWPTGSFGEQCLAVAQLIAAGISLPVYKISLSGFDNHSTQRAKHDDLLAQLARGLKGLRDALVEKGRFNDVLIMTYSEFGRRVDENGSQGTDHGTAAPHFVVGSTANIVGGVLYGSQPSLAPASLDSRGDLVHGTDYRKLYATAGSFLGFPTAGAIGAGHTPVSGLLR